MATTPEHLHELPLSRGYVALIDAADFERQLLCEFSDGFLWHGRICDRKWQSLVKSHTTYAVVLLDQKTKPRELRLHRLLMCARAGQVIDHIDGNGLNNSRSNLRRATAAENARNRSPNRSAANRFKGVTRHKLTGKFEAYIKCRGKKIHLGLFDSDEAAARAYDARAKRLFRQFAKLNFPLTQGSAVS